MAIYFRSFVVVPHGNWMTSVAFNSTSDLLFHDNRWWSSGEAAEVNSWRELESHQKFRQLYMVCRFNLGSQIQRLCKHTDCVTTHSCREKADFSSLFIWQDASLWTKYCQSCKGRHKLFNANGRKVGCGQCLAGGELGGGEIVSLDMQSCPDFKLCTILHAELKKTINKTFKNVMIFGRFSNGEG